MKMISRVLVMLALAWCMVASAAEENLANAPSAYRVLKAVEVGGEGRWDYLTVDEIGHRLFVPRSNRVTVLDLASDDLRQIGEIASTDGVHGVAIASKIGRGFTSNGKDNTSTIFDLNTLKPLASVHTGDGPDAIVFDPATNNVFVINHKGGTITAYDGNADIAQPVKTTEIAIGGTLEYAAVDGAGHLYVNIEDKNQTVAINTREMKVAARWPLGEGEEPTGMAIDSGKALLFVTCHNSKIVVLDSRSGKIVSTLPIGKNVDGCAFDAQRELAFSSNGEGTLTIINTHNAAEPVVAATLNTQPGARTIALDPVTHRLYLPTARFAPAQAGQPSTRPTPIPGSFTILVVGQQ